MNLSLAAFKQRKKYILSPPSSQLNNTFHSWLVIARFSPFEKHETLLKKEKKKRSLNSSLSWKFVASFYVLNCKISLQSSFSNRAPGIIMPLKLLTLPPSDKKEREKNERGI